MKMAAGAIAWAKVRDIAPIVRKIIDMVSKQRNENR